MLISNSSLKAVARPATAALSKTEVKTEVADHQIEAFERPSAALMTIYSRSPEALHTGGRAAKGLLGLAAGGALGAYAGSATGVLAGIAGGASLALPGAMLGAVTVGVLAERFGTSGSDTAGAALWGGVAGLAGALAVGGYVGSQVAGPAVALGLGLVGGLVGSYCVASN